MWLRLKVEMRAADYVILVSDRQPMQLIDGQTVFDLHKVAFQAKKQAEADAKATAEKK